MKEVRVSELVRQIAEDNNLSCDQKIKTYSTDFPLKNGKRKINSSWDSIIVDKDGNEFPYMLTRTQRNEERLVEFDYIYIIRFKTLDQILKEANLTLTTEKCRICEGGGWYSNGLRYYYKDIYCEL